MQILDNQGRLFGKMNIIDAAVLVVVCLLIPLAYGAYLLFRIPQPRIVAVEPARVPQGTAQVTVRGEHLRPYLRMTVGTQTAKLLFESADSGPLILPPSLPPGSYDVVLYDEAQELGRLPGGLVIGEPPDADSSAALTAIGAFRGLDADGARAISQTLRETMRTATPLGPIAGLLPPEPNFEYLRPNALPVSDGPYQIRAVLRLRCVLTRGECRVGNTPLVPDATIPVPVGDRTVDFLVEELHSNYNSRVELEVRVVLAPEVANVIRGRQRQGDDFPARDALRPSLVSVTANETTAGSRMARILLPALKTPDALSYRGQALRVGGYFILETPSYQLGGTIVSIRVR